MVLWNILIRYECYFTWVQRNTLPISIAILLSWIEENTSDNPSGSNKLQWEKKLSYKISQWCKCLLFCSLICKRWEESATYNVYLFNRQRDGWGGRVLTSRSCCSRFESQLSWVSVFVLCCELIVCTTLGRDGSEAQSDCMDAPYFTKYWTGNTTSQT